MEKHLVVAAFESSSKKKTAENEIPPSNDNEKNL